MTGDEYLRRVLPPERYAAWRRGESVGPRLGPGFPQSREIKPIPPLQPVPRDQWPFRVRMVARFKVPADKGVGDTLARLINKLPVYKGMGAGDAWKKFTTWLGIECGCCARQRRANEQYPY